MVLQIVQYCLLCLVVVGCVLVLQTVLEVFSIAVECGWAGWRSVESVVLRVFWVNVVRARIAACLCCFVGFMCAAGFPL